MKKFNKVLIITGGILTLTGGIFHLGFWYFFHWEESLDVLDRLNQNMMLMLNYCIAAFFFLLGIGVLRYREMLLENSAGRYLMLTLGLVFLVRLVMEFILPNSSLILGGLLLMMTSCYILPLLFSKKRQNFPDLDLKNGSIFETC